PADGRAGPGVAVCALQLDGARHQGRCHDHGRYLFGWERDGWSERHDLRERPLVGGWRLARERRPDPEDERDPRLFREVGEGLDGRPYRDRRELTGRDLG